MSSLFKVMSYETFGASRLLLFSLKYYVTFIITFESQTQCRIPSVLLLKNLITNIFLQRKLEGSTNF